MIKRLISRLFDEKLEFRLRIFNMLALGGIIISYMMAIITVFQGGTLPSLVKEIIEKRPAVAGLIVYVDDLAQARVDLAKKGHPLNLFFNQVRSK